MVGHCLETVGKTVSRLGRWDLWGLVPIFLSIIVFRDLSSGYFYYDDFKHLYDIANKGFLEPILTPHGGHAYLVRNTILYALFESFGLNPKAYFALGFLLHLVNVALLYRILRVGVEDTLIAVVGASLWGMSATHFGCLGWISAHGQVLLGTFLAWVLFDVIRIEKRALSPSRGMLVRWILLLVLGVFTFGIGVGCAAVFGGVVWLLMPQAKHRNRIAAVLGILLFAAPALYFGQYVLYHAFTGLTDADKPLLLLNFAWKDVGSIVSSVLNLMVYGESSFVLGGLIAFGRSGVAFGPLEGLNANEAMLISYIVAFILLSVVVVAYLKATRNDRMQLLAFMILLSICYATIALPRYIFMVYFVGMTPSEFYLTDRYHYVGSLFACILTCFAVGMLAGQRVRRGPWVLLSCTVFLVGQCYLSSGAVHVLGQGTYGAGRIPFTRAVDSLRSIIASAPADAMVLLNNRTFSGYPPTEDSGNDKDFPGLAALFVLAFPDNVVDGKTVRFVENKAVVVQEARRVVGRRSATLLITPEEAQALRVSREAGTIFSPK